MSALSRDLHRHVAWLESLSAELQEVVRELSAAALVSGSDGGWTEEQAEAVREAIREWGDECGRQIGYAIHTARQFTSELRDSERLGR